MATIPSRLTVTTTTNVALSPLARLAGPLALATGILIIIQQLVMFAILDRSQLIATMAHPLFVPSAIAYFIVFCALLIALVAVYTWQADRAGAFGVIGFVAALVGTMFLAGDGWFEAFVVPWLADVAPVVLKPPVPFGLLMIGAFTSYVLFSAGWVLFGLASLRARAFPVAISVAIVVSGIIGFQALVPPYAVPLGLTMTWLGVWMLRTTRATSKISAPATV
jgi:hypothetical protein